MGGKSWSDAEEAYFWRWVAPYSHTRGGVFLANDEVTWEDLAQRMANHFGAGARRQYSHAVLYEHWFLNMQIRTKSPNAEPHLTRYIRRAGIPNPYDNGGNNAAGRTGRGSAPSASATAAAVPAGVGSGSGSAELSPAPASEEAPGMRQGIMVEFKNFDSPAAAPRATAKEAAQRKTKPNSLAGDSSNSDGL